jgi:fatty acid kinase fatty acid binding subunit
LQQFDITVVPSTVRWGADTLVDTGGPISADQLERLTSDEGPKPVVEPPTVDEFNQVYRSMRDTCDGIISLHTSAKLSETLANAGTAREAFGPVGHGGPFPIAVVDSQTTSMGLGWLTLAVGRAASAGLDLAKLVSITSRMRGSTHVAFITDQLEGLMPGGKMPNQRPSWAMPGSINHGGSLTSLKPLFHIDEGQVSVYERTRTRAKARDALYNFVEDFPKIGEMAVLHVGALNDLDHLLTRIGAIYPRERIVLLEPSLSVAAWLGPEALGVAVFEGEEGA